MSILKDQREETWKPELVAAIHKLTGDTIDIKVAPAASYLVVEFRHTSPNKKPKWFDPDGGQSAGHRQEGPDDAR